MRVLSLNQIPLGIVLTGCALVAVGCSRGTDYNDVQAARETVQEEQRETAAVRNETAEDIAEAKRHEQAVRHEALKPVTEADSQAVRDAAAATAETRHEGAKAIQEEQKEAADAQAKLRDTEARFAATKARDEFATAHDAKLKAAVDRIDTLKDKASKEEGAAKDATDMQITELQQAHDRAKESLDNVKSADDILKWSMHRDNVEKAFNDLQTEMDQTK